MVLHLAKLGSIIVQALLTNIMSLPTHCIMEAFNVFLFAYKLWVRERHLLRSLINGA